MKKPLVLTITPVMVGDMETLDRTVEFDYGGRKSINMSAYSYNGMLAGTMIDKVGLESFADVYDTLRQEKVDYSLKVFKNLRSKSLINKLALNAVLATSRLAGALNVDKRRAVEVNDSCTRQLPEFTGHQETRRPKRIFGRHRRRRYLLAYN